VIGEGDITAPRLFRSVMDGKRESLPEIVHGEVASVDKIQVIAGGTIIGLIEVTRGCARSCAFCAPSVRKVRSLPLERILDDVRVNIESGNDGVILHGEDMLLYQSDGLTVNEAAVVELIDKVYKVPGVKFIGISHVSLSSIVSSPRTVKKIAEILELGSLLHPVNYWQVGIETGSPDLIGKLMKGKVYPYKPEEWSDTVREGLRISHENHFVCCATIILGLPGEIPEDVEITTNLVKSLFPYQSVIIPLFFTPMQTTRLENQKPFTKKDLTPVHDKLLEACWEHNGKWFPELWKYYGRNKNIVLRKSVDFFLKTGIRYFQGRMRRDAAKRKGPNRLSNL
jgi:Fe-S oxidoreductase